MSAPVDVLAVPLVVRTAPERIWLQIADDSYSATEAFPHEALDQITWCADSVMDTEVKYVRADLLAELIQAIEDVLSHRIGEQPVRGWLRDNNFSRTALTRLATAATAAKGGAA